VNGDGRDDLAQAQGAQQVFTWLVGQPGGSFAPDTGQVSPVGEGDAVPGDARVRHAMKRWLGGEGLLLLVIEQHAAYFGLHQGRHALRKLGDQGRRVAQPAERLGHLAHAA